MNKKIILNFLCMGLSVCLMAQPVQKGVEGKRILAGAERMHAYVHMLQGKRVGLFANQTSVVGARIENDTVYYTHLVDTLLKQGVKITKIFSPEHGFRGTADAGEKVQSGKDAATGIPIISLYGAASKPTAQQLTDVDVLVFDIQDVGVRFYTYISSLEYFMEAALEQNKPLLILDRPNPNGFYVDGPVLKNGYRSFVGMQPVPVVYGMTIGEYGLMLMGQKWLNSNANSKVKPAPFNHGENGYQVHVIPCENYDHSYTYDLPVKPSPNLPNAQSVLLYPSTCFFEGTVLSLGRGTPFPFQVFGHPALPDTLYSFTPRSVPGATNPPLLNKKSYGYNLTGIPIDVRNPAYQMLNPQYVLTAYELFADKDNFFLAPRKSNPAGSDFFFNKLAGTDKFMWQIMNGKSAAEIRASWQPEIRQFMPIRAKYLLYP